MNLDRYSPHAESAPSPLGIGNLKDRLNQQGFRFTSQRQKILDIFATHGQGSHLDAEAVHSHLQDQGEHISLSTIYRALHVMVRLGVLRELELAEGRKYYEIAPTMAPTHHHLVCVQCGQVVEFEDPRINTASARETQRLGYALLDCQFTIYGLCADCATPLLEVN